MAVDLRLIAQEERSRVRRRAEGGISSTEMRFRLGLSEVQHQRLFRF